MPGGISTKATEYKQLAAKGDKWESPVFGIGSASESSNIPKVAQVGRKAHNAAAGGVRGTQNLEPGSSTFGQAEPKTDNTAGFGNEVNQAFGTENDLSLKGSSPNGGVANGTTGTTLGASNPVLSGSA